MKKFTCKTKHLQVPFKMSYNHNLAKRLTSDSVLLKITDQQGFSGFGEATPRYYVTGEDSVSMIKTFKQNKEKYFAPFDGTIESISACSNLINPKLTSLQSLIQGVLLDYLCAIKDCTIFDLFDINQEKIINYTASITGGSDKLFKKMVQLYAQNKMKQVKLKVEKDPVLNIERIQYVKANMGDDVMIRMDGNEIWDFNEAKHQIPRLIDEGVTCFEQLFHKDDWIANKRCHEEFGQFAEFIVDESLTSNNSLEKILSMDSIHGANLKISKNGGLLQCLEMAKQLEAHGKSIRLGAHVGETSSLTLNGITFSLLISKMKEIEGAAGDNLLSYDPFQPSLKFGYKGNINADSTFLRTTKLIFQENSSVLAN